MKTLSLLLILCLCLTYSGNCQVITYDNQSISFDSISARKLLQTAYERDNFKTESKILKEIIASYDSVVMDQETIISDLKNQAFDKSDSLSAWQNRYYVDAKKAVTNHKKLMWYVRGSLALVFLVAIFK